MSNMSYCRFENTSLDLEDCLQAFRDRQYLSEMEANAFIRLLDTMNEFQEEIEEAIGPGETLDDVRELKEKIPQLFEEDEY